MKRFAIAASVAAAILCAVACSSSKACASTCTGCCDAADKCQAGNTPLGCGFAGSFCHQCVLGQSCLGGTCVTTTGASGGGSATGGGSTNGGGGGGTGAGGGTSTGGGQGAGGGTSSGGGAAVGGGGGTTGAGGGTAVPMPNVMFVIDKSGSMLEPMNPNDPNCPAGCGASTACPAACPTRWGQLSDGVSNFLGSNAQLARWGAEFFPADTVCTAASLSTISDAGVDLPTAADSPGLLQAQAMAVSTRVVATVPGGGTPTAASLNVLTSYPQLGDATRHEWVVLFTDGVPNCNANNPNTCNDPNACQCTLVSGSCTTASGYCQLGCVDVDGTAMAEISLQQHGIKTVVMGIGTDLLTGNGPQTMQTMGQAGGYVRTCPFGTNTECLPGTCDTTIHVCSVPYFAIGSATELTQALQTVAATF